jgi:transposase-like protein
LTAAERREAVLVLLGREEPGAKVARRIGVSEQTLYRWRDDFLAGGEAALANGKGGTDSRDREIRELKKEVERRDQVIGELTIANRILKKQRTARIESYPAGGHPPDDRRRENRSTDSGLVGTSDPNFELVSPADPGKPTSSAGSQSPSSANTCRTRSSKTGENDEGS